MLKKIVLAAYLMAAGEVAAQDYIISWTGDTVNCRMLADPAREKLRPRYKYLNGHYRLAVVFNSDSLRVLEAGDVKAYYRKHHGKNFLCNGFFEAKKISTAAKTGLSGNLAADPNYQWYFMRQVVKGDYASLHAVYTTRGSRASLSYYISMAGPDSLYSKFFSTKRKALRYLAGKANKKEFVQLKYRRSMKGYIDIVNMYNQVMGSVGSREKNEL
jgi:hypothetical protein